MSSHFLPVTVLIATIVVLLTVLSLRRSHGVSYLVSGAGLLFAMLTAFSQMEKAPYYSDLFVFTPVTAFLSLILLIVVGMLWVQLHQWLETLDERKEEYYLLVLFTAIGALLMIATNHFASFFLSMELMSLSFVGLVAYSSKATIAQEAGIKYLILSAIASALLLMGIAMLYLQYGTLLFTDLTVFSAATAMPAWITVTAVIFILTGMFFKLSLVPCHLWIADLIEGAPLPTAALMATLSKLAIFVVLWRMFTIGQWHYFNSIVEIITAVAMVSMLVGNLLGLLQNNLLRLLAYSSIAHFGYLLIILLIQQSPKDSFLANSFTTEAMVFYLVGYLFTLIGVFSVLLQLPKLNSLDDLKGLFWHNPTIALTLTMLMLSLAGIPLTIGFMGKFYLLITAVDHQLWWLLSALVIGSVIGLFYYLRVIMMMVKPPADENLFTGVQLSNNSLLLNYLTIFLVIGFGTFPAAFSQLIQHLSQG